MTLCASVQLFRSAATFVAAIALLSGCATAPPPARLPPLGDVAPPPGSLETPMPTPQSGATASIGSEIVLRAISLLGAPYRFGASGPKAFDCSGLVQFVHEELGIFVPRTAAEQYKAAAPVRLEDIEPGDLLFFRISGKRISHVAIYAGSGRFVHAPQTGRPIELRLLDDDYYKPRLAGAGRLF
ncbi:cell wall-associated NlpC family hydrolase [Povalibacter uvarum]|uniref:Cell wall-associated NlpC family hydrolase n=1 Tax=Povalibacter uvarum TaxID=732238 RepID=A0A841HPC9_9GAMM|nr:C40 family peptidase [Povalibacter uvarum]MBB6094494.1 cell wall-associated NlpC family hydrolase [Povalibacter uvarum]